METDIITQTRSFSTTSDRRGGPERRSDVSEKGESVNEILVVGSLAYDTISTPEGRVDRALGGSANYFSLAASLFAPVRVVGVVGEDYDATNIELLSQRGIDVSGMEKAAGKTFHWEGEYGRDNNMNEAVTLATHLNVLADFNPKIPANYKNSNYVFLANIDPDLQMRVLDQVEHPRFVAMDTMNYWISSKLDSLKKILERVDALLINEGEAQQLTGKSNAVAAAAEITKLGPKAVVIKRGEYGFLLYTENQYFILPAFPIARVVDPTGAGDTFAGGFFGYLARHEMGHGLEDLKRACVEGCLLASFTVQDFGTKAIQSVSLEKLNQRHLEYSRIISYPQSL
ncbi:MAG: PfkB family carbohydrate kinase [Bdellovibrionales bacterium]